MPGRAIVKWYYMTSRGLKGDEMMRGHARSLIAGVLVSILLLAVPSIVWADDQAPDAVTSSTGVIREVPPVTSSLVVDAFEVDDTPATASYIEVNGEGQLHLFGVAGDVDWIRFHAEAGKRYLIATEDLLGACDPILSLFTADGEPRLLAENDDFAEGPDARLIWVAPETGDYLIRVVEKEDRYGLGIGYRLVVREGNDVMIQRSIKRGAPMPPVMRP